MPRHLAFDIKDPPHVFFIMHVSFLFGSTKMDYIYTFNALCVAKALMRHVIGPTQCSTGTYVNVWCQYSTSIMVSKDLPVGVKLKVLSQILIFDGYLKVRKIVHLSY